MSKVGILCLATLPGFLFGQTGKTPSFPGISDDEWETRNPTYSIAVSMHLSADSWLAQQESEIESETTEYGRLLRLGTLAEASLCANHGDRAGKYAVEALKLAEKYSKPVVVVEDGIPVSNVGEVVFHSYLVLGRLALAQGDIETAKKDLLLAGKTGGTPSLGRSGPGMSLARELLKASEQESVLQFLEECRAFWKFDGGRLDLWSAQIRSGAIPDFGVNLFF